ARTTARPACIVRGVMNPSLTASPQNGWGGAPPPRKSSGLATGCAVAAGVVLLLIIGSCIVVRLYGPRWTRRLVQRGQQEMAQMTGVVQSQATALGQAPPDLATACGYNSLRLQTAMPCPTYVAWLGEHAPFFAGSTVRMAGVQQQFVQGQMHAIIT